jgi:hypothetical protein
MTRGKLMTDTTHGHLPPDNVTNHQLYILLLQQGGEIRELTRTVQRQETLIEDQGAELAELREAWDNATGVVRFVKIAGGIAAAIGAIVGLWKLVTGG